MEKGLPVSGYRPQSEENIALVNEAKELEERTLRFLDRLAASGRTDGRWLSIGRTDIEKGFMAVNRSVFQPARISLPEEIPAKSDQVAWVIEHGGSPISKPLYFCGGEATWTYDHLQACRFVREQDAAATVRLLDEGGYRVCEHAWS